jgi:hypothetical protein
MYLHCCKRHTVETVVTFNLPVDRATRADPCDAGKLKLPAMMAGYFRLLQCQNTAVATSVCVRVCFSDRF